MKAKQHFDPSPEIIKSLLKLNRRKAFFILDKSNFFTKDLIIFFTKKLFLI